MNTKIVAILIAAHLGAVSAWGGWPPIVDTKDDVQRLSISVSSVRARGLADSDIPSLARLHKLRILDFLSGWGDQEAKITDEGLRRLASLDLPHLENLSLGWCDKITDAGLAHVGKLPSLTWLGLPACSQISDAGLPQLVTAKNLTGLDLRGCRNITDAGIQQLAAKANWQNILLGGCPRVTMAGVARLQAALPNAKIDKNEEEWNWMNQRQPPTHSPLPDKTKGETPRGARARPGQ